MPGKVLITGTGIISAIGNNTAQALDSLKNARSGIGKIRNLETIYRDQIPVAEVRYENERLADFAGIKESGRYTRTALLGINAASEAWQNAGLNEDSVKKYRIGLISASSVGGMDRSENFYKKFHKNPDSGRLRDIINHDCGESTEKIAKYLGIKDYMTTISTACSSSANSIMFAARLIRNGFLDIAVAGGTDALTVFTLNGFNTLMILDKTHCKPFDENRNGLTIGEGAGFIVLESEKASSEKSKIPLCCLSGYGNACDAHHQTASSPEGDGAYLAIKKALDNSGLNINEIDYVNVHGTGTANNDLSEGKALQRIFGENLPPFSSTKAFTGHTLGAAGGIEAVISILSIHNNMIFPNLNFSTPIKELNMIPVTKVISGRTINHVLSDSFGFGGNNSALIFSKY